MLAPGLELDPLELAGAVADGSGKKHLAAGRDSCDAGGQVHGRAKPITAAVDAGP
jgi:hypothetical protein